ncbi:MAG: hypothetical protein CFE45_04385 [Burkholderiales bacterium PBB5]|nr:MAG: hypothetical protein CFE45_04385 [Burkholderiales bacterium PBB5]
MLGREVNAVHNESLRYIQDDGRRIFALRRMVYNPASGESKFSTGNKDTLARADSAAVRQLDLDQLQRLATGHGSRERFVTELTLDPPEASSDESGPPHRDEDYLILSTIHSAKGQEWNAVTVLNVVDGCLPADLSTGSAAAVAEERRLLYVAMTRARQHLALMVPLRFHVSQQHRLGDRHLYGGLSRFIPPNVAALFDAMVPDPATGDGPAPSPAPTTASPLRLGAAWD